MGLRVQTQAAMLRMQRQIAESQGEASDLITSPLRAPQRKKKRDGWHEATDTDFSDNLRAELRTICEARLAALADMTVIEQQASETAVEGDTLAKLRDLANLYAESADRPSHAPQTVEYHVLQDQIQRVVQTRVMGDDKPRAEEVAIASDYFAAASDNASSNVNLSVSPLPQTAPAAIERALGQMSEYKNYLRSIHKSLTSRFDSLRTQTRELCETDAPIDTDSFACDVAVFTQKKILGAADQSLKSHEGLVPKVALSLISP